MVVFSRLIPDSNIIKAAEDLTSVAIVGCPACANISIAYEKDHPVYRITTDETTGKTRRLPYALREHSGRLNELIDTFYTPTPLLLENRSFNKTLQIAIKKREAESGTRDGVSDI